MSARGLAAALCALALGAVPSHADDGVSVRATVDASELSVGETLRLTVEVRGSGMSGVEPAVPKDLANLDLVSGPSTSTQFSFVNGAVSSSKSFTWILTPRAAGAARIPPQTVKVGDKTYRTEPIEVKVSSAGAGDAARARPLRGGSAGERDPGTSEVRLENEISATKVYVGQPVVLSTRLVTSIQVVDVSQGPDPTLPGFLLEETETNVTPERVFREGREYQAFVLMRRILTPTTAGRTTIPSEKRTIRLRARGGDPWQAFFSPSTIDIARASAPIELEVLAPPRDGRPADFSGAVGSFHLEAVADRKEAAVGEGIGFQVTVTGNGNLKTALAPVFPPSADFRVFDPRVEEKATGVKPRAYTKTWSYVLTPLSPGAGSLPAVSFTVFDPEAGAYRRLTSREAPLVVKRAEPGAVTGGGAAVASVPRREVQALQRDIRFLKTLDRPLTRNPGTPPSRLWILAVLGLSIAVQPLAWYAGRRGGIGALWPGAARARARKRALGAIARAEKRSDGSTLAPVTASKALLGFLADRCRVPAAGLTYDAIEEELSRRGVRAELRGELRALLELCDLGRFAPEEQRGGQGGAGADGGGLLRRASSLVDRLDREIGRAA